MHVLQVLLLFVLTWSVIDGTVLRPVRLVVYSDQYIDIRIGNPGKLVRLRLRFDLNETYLYERPDTYSETFALGPPANDIFYFAQVKVRLRVIYSEEADRRLDTSDSVDYGGCLAMGPNSQIWTLWNEFSLSRSTLTFGAYDPLDALSAIYYNEQVQGNIGPPPEASIAWNYSTPGLPCPLEATLQLNSEVSHDFLQYASLLTPTELTTRLGSSRIDTTTGALVVPFVIRLEEEYSYLPGFVYSLMENGDIRHDKPSFWNLSESAITTCIGQRGSNASFQLKQSLSDSLIVTPYLAKQTILRMSEQNIARPLPKGYASFGRITATRTFVLHVDMVRRKMSLLRSYDSEPLMINDLPHLLITVVSVVLWIWWIFSTHPMLYQLTRELAFARMWNARNNNATIAVATATAANASKPKSAVASTAAPVSNTSSYRNPDTSSRDIRQRKLRTYEQAAAANLIGDAIDDAFIAGGAYNVSIRPLAMNEELEKKKKMDNLRRDMQKRHPSVLLSNAEKKSAREMFRDRFVRLYAPLNLNSVEVVLFVTRIVAFFTIYCALEVFHSVHYCERLARLALLSSEAGAIGFYLSIASCALISCVNTVEFFKAFPFASIHLTSANILLVAWISQLPDTNGGILDLFTNLIVSGTILVYLLSWAHSSLFHGPDYSLLADTDRVNTSPLLSRPLSGVNIKGASLLWIMWIVILIPLAVLFFYYLNLLPVIELNWPGTSYRWATGLFVIICIIGPLSLSAASRILIQPFYEVAMRVQQVAHKCTKQ